MKIKALLALSLIFFSFQLSAQESAATAVQKQLDAYNAHNIEDFLSAYSDSVKIYNHPKQLTMSGKEQMRAAFSGMFTQLKDLHCTLLNRMVLGNTVIDQEYVIFDKNDPPKQVFAMYKVAKGKIYEVYFIEPEIDNDK
ncbi:nuclear transport factor 2 family protein [Roseivirga sp. E12]|uniref:nuclear transport factor 2 family protein n=1 Tax=Roseivirga sp. E12 TaxID=2819237 RepID=UPI001ABBF5F0|nr:nuclear transport factor 2 family protein [Roseivirga sp. E12]MBO3700567.1 nuclear transport factor 2 family protein [Roseivirga sp. E12]